MKTKTLLFVFTLLSFLLAPPRCPAQWLTETVPLVPGWNAVYLSVEPAHADCAALFAGLPVQSVSIWSRREPRLQFTTAPDQLLPQNPDWLYWLPTSHPQSLLNSLHAVHGGQSFLLRLATNAAPVTWRIQGTPVPFRPRWLAQSLNLTGLPVQADRTTFDSFFRPSPIKSAPADGGEIYQVNGAGRGLKVMLPVRTTVDPSLAYWIRCGEATDYAGPLRVTLDYGAVLEYGAGVWTRRLSLKNESPTASTVQVSLRPSETPPAGAAPLAGPVPLSYRERDWSQGQPREVFKPLAPSVSRTLAPGQTWTLELAPRRAEMSGAVAGASWQSLLEVTDGGTVRQWIGVRAQ